MAKILVVDDEKQIRRFLNISLESYNHKVYLAEKGHQGLALAALERPELIILDLQLPDMDGLKFLKKIREWSRIPIIVLTVKDAEEDKITLLESGADDYLTKPFSVGELNARIKVALRHLSNNEEEKIIFKSGNLEIDFFNRLTILNNKEIKLTPTEYSLLCYLAKNCGRVLTHNQILKELWGPEFLEETQYLRTYIMQLRKKIEIDFSNPEYIITEPGVGYRLLDIEL